MTSTRPLSRSISSQTESHSAHGKSGGNLRTSLTKRSPTGIMPAVCGMRHADHERGTPATVKPSSRNALIAALVLALASAILYLTAQDTPAPDLTESHVQGMLRDIAAAVRRRDADAAFAHVTRDALLFGEKRARLEQYARRSLREASAGALSIRWQNLTVATSGDRGTAEFDVAVSERLGGIEAEYFSSHVTLYFRKQRRPGTLGLGSVEEWLVDRAVSSTDVFAGQ